MRFYVSILQSYLQYLKISNAELIKEWENNIKPFLLKKYPFQQSGIFNVNADIKFLIQEIDNLNKNGKNNRNKFSNQLNNNAYKRKTINDNKINIKQNYNKIKNEREEDFSPLKINDLKIEKEKEKYEPNINIIKIKDSLEENNDNNQNKILYCPTISSQSTSISIYDELNKKNSIKNNYLTDIPNKSRSFLLNKEMNPNFCEEFETEKITIVHKKENSKVITKMTFNLFLKKIVINNFYNEYIIYATNFAEQCFYFLKKELVFKKVINCYQYYSNLKVPLNQRRNLVFFMNLLVIKMYAHYTKISNKDETFLQIKDFYNNVINELKQSINKSKKTTEKIQNFIVDGFNAIIQGVNNIKDNFDKKTKNINTNNKNSKSPDNLKKHIEKEDLKLKNNNNINTKDINNNNKEKEINEDEELLKECEKIVTLFKSEQPKNELLLKMEKSLYIYILKVKFKIKINSSKNSEKSKLTKSYSEKNMLNYTLDKKNKKNNNNKNYFYCLEWNTRDIGEELIYVTQTALNSIKRKELYNGAFTKKNKQTDCPGIMDNINKFNNLTFFIIEDIISYDFPEKRAKIIEKWANVADYCRRRKDYNDIFSINSAFKHFIIANLKLTWKEIGNKTMKLIKDLSNFCSFQGNYKNVREDMKLLTGNDFYTPYLGLLLKDLNYFEENYKYLDNSNLISFEKINGVQGAIDKFFHFQKTADKRVTMLPEELNFFENLEVQNESKLEKLAQQLEPKFTLYLNPKSEKRLTSVDIKYFQKHSTKSKSNDVALKKEI